MPISCHLRQELQQLFKEQGRSETQGKTWLYLSLPEIVDLSYWCSAIEDQGSLNTCTAHAGVALVEYFAKRSSNRYEDLSRLFLYKVARNLMNRQGDTGASVRETMRAMVLFGVPPEDRWPYVEANFEAEPDPFCYAYAQNYQAIKYCRLDRVGMSPSALLAQIKAVLVAGLPCMFGFTAYQSIYAEHNVCLGHIPYPTRNDVMAGGHAMVAVGYDDHHVIESDDDPDNPSVGAILVRNSWGTDWGQGGYGWLPYDYILGELTADWWVLLKAEWLSQTSFGGESAAWTSRLGGRPKPGRETSSNPRAQRQVPPRPNRRR
jgi:C1A family cysteine protease